MQKRSPRRKPWTVDAYPCRYMHPDLWVHADGHRLCVI